MRAGSGEVDIAMRNVIINVTDGSQRSLLDGDMNSLQLAMQHRQGSAVASEPVTKQLVTLTLSEVDVGEQVTLLTFSGGNHITLRLLSMGVRSGQQVQVLHNRTGAVVIAAGSGRIAVGKKLAQQITVQRR